MRNSFPILSIPIHPYTMSETLAFIDKSIQEEKKTFIVTANAEIVMKANEDNSFKELICLADIVLPDGAGVVWAGKHLGYHVPERVAGYDLVQNIFPLAAKKQYKLYFLGAAPTVAATAAKNILKKYPMLDIIGTHDGFFDQEEEEKIIREINAQKTDIILVALGAPKQEQWIVDNMPRLCANIFIGIGGTFNVMAGTAKRAPLWMQKIGMEWSYRLLCEPTRIFRMIALPRFVIKVLKSKKK